MASPNQWTWVWVDSASWWRTGRPGVLQFMVSQRIRHGWQTELISSQSFSGDQSFCLPINLCLSEFKCINFLLWSWRGDLVGQHHYTVCTIVSWGWGVGGAGFDGLQVTSFLSVCQHLWLGSSVVPGLKPEVRQRLPFPQWLLLSYWGQGGMPSFWSRSPESQARSGCVTSGMYAPLSQHCNPFHRGTRGACSG